MKYNHIFIAINFLVSYYAKICLGAVSFNNTVCYSYNVITTTNETIVDVDTNTASTKVSTEVITVNIDMISFLILSDWGKGGTTGTYGQNSNSNGKNNKVLYQHKVASGMNGYILSTDLKPQFILALGDNFYNNGVASTSDILWSYLWEYVYLQPYTTMRIPWYSIFGNHDYGYGETGLQAQIDKSKVDTLWKTPAYNYTGFFHCKDDLNVQVVFIDTTTLAPSQNKATNTNGGISVELQASRIADQLMHVESMLQEATANNPTFLIVAGHYPIVSRGEHGDMSELLINLEPLLVQYGVDVYICGHDHLSMHLKYHGIDHFIVGSGSMISGLGSYSSLGKLLWYGTDFPAFASVNVTSNNMTLTYIDSDSQVRYSYTILADNSSIPTAQPTSDDIPESHYRTAPPTDEQELEPIDIPHHGTDDDDYYNDNDNDQAIHNPNTHRSNQTLQNVGLSVSAITGALVLLYLIQANFCRKFASTYSVNTLSHSKTDFDQYNERKYISKEHLHDEIRSDRGNHHNNKSVYTCDTQSSMESQDGIIYDSHLQTTATNASDDDDKHDSDTDGSIDYAASHLLTTINKYIIIDDVYVTKSRDIPDLYLGISTVNHNDERTKHRKSNTSLF